MTQHKNKLWQNRTVAIMGCDPGPTHSALALITAYEGDILLLAGAWYKPNEELASIVPEFAGPHETAGDGPLKLFAYERCGLMGRFVGQSVFETAAMGGELRRAYRPLATQSFALRPSDWKLALTGVGNSKTPAVYEAICREFEPTGGGSDPYRGTKKQPGPLWGLYEAGAGGKVTHMKDALGIAISVLKMEDQTGKSIGEFRVSF